MEIRLDGSPLAVTMRTPGDDFDLVHGFLATRGSSPGRGHRRAAVLRRGVDAEGRNTYNVVDVDLAPACRIPDTGLERNYSRSSSCGVCGKASIDAIRTENRFDVAGRRRGGCPRRCCSICPTGCGARSGVLDRTGGLHAARCSPAPAT